MTPSSPINLSLISHTNVGKTTLARTLLGYDVGEIVDGAHTTREATAYRLIDTAEGDQLLLWDTPGFGDSARLIKRLNQQGNPVGWFLSQVWDRYRDRAFWLTQLAVRNVRDQADVVLYLVNVSEQPEDAGYLAPEFSVLQWIGKPVIVLLNQTGAPQAGESEDERRWREYLKQWPHVLETLSLDGFARCWVQEFLLFEALGRVLPAERSSGYERLALAWENRRRAQFAESMQALAQPIAAAAQDHAPMPSRSWLDQLGNWVGLNKDDGKSELAAAVRAMAERLQARLRESTDRMIDIHQLKGRAVDTLRTRLEDVAADQEPLAPAKAATLFGILSGALGGLSADIASGGLTFGGGMLVGAVMGALGAAGVAQGLNVARGSGEPMLRWDNAFLDGLVISALMRYLAVAHFGRGRGEWQENDYPAAWFQFVTEAVTERKGRLAAIWNLRETGGDNGRIEAALAPVLEELARSVLGKLHPEGSRLAFR
jgi:GTPase SAR1 family protein